MLLTIRHCMLTRFATLHADEAPDNGTERRAATGPRARSCGHACASQIRAHGEADETTAEGPSAPNGDAAAVIKYCETPLPEGRDSSMIVVGAPRRQARRRQRCNTLNTAARTFFSMTVLDLNLALGAMLRITFTKTEARALILSDDV
eukprot:6182184-Pleurochrysis_carterae.AAC.1